MPGLRRVFGTVTRMSTLETLIATVDTSLDLIAGACGDIIDLTDPEIFDCTIGGSVMTGSSVTSARSMSLYIIAQMNDAPTWVSPVVPGAVCTFASTDARANACVFGGMAYVPVTTVNLAYPIKPFSVRALFPGGKLPRRIVPFFAHNLGADLNATPANHRLEYYTEGLETF